MSTKLQGRVAAFRRINGSTFEYLGRFDPRMVPAGAVVTTLVAASSALDRAHRSQHDGARLNEETVGMVIPVTALPVNKRHTSGRRVVAHRDAINARSRFEREFTAQGTSSKKVLKALGL